MLHSGPFWGIIVTPVFSSGFFNKIFAISNTTFTCSVREISGYCYFHIFKIIIHFKLDKFLINLIFHFEFSYNWFIFNFVEEISFIKIKHFGAVYIIKSRIFPNFRIISVCFVNKYLWRAIQDIFLFNIQVDMCCTVEHFGAL